MSSRRAGAGGPRAWNGERMRYRDRAAAPGRMEPGARNSISDVPGVSVGHATIRHGSVNTGVTAIVPQPGNLFRQKLTAAVEVVNGFGKSAGLVQVAELGTLETPVLLTNTFGVGTCVDALIRRAIAENPDIGRATSTVNAVVCECNDGALSDIQAMAVTEADAAAALDAAGPEFSEGSVGAGTGMSSFGFKGGIGSASRRLHIAEQLPLDRFIIHRTDRLCLDQRFILLYRPTDAIAARRHQLVGGDPGQAGQDPRLCRGAARVARCHQCAAVCARHLRPDRL